MPLEEGGLLSPFTNSRETRSGFAIAAQAAPGLPSSPPEGPPTSSFTKGPRASKALVRRSACAAPEVGTLGGSMSNLRRPLLVILIVLNCVVLLGQLWPEGAPPFARAVNIGFLTLALGYFVWAVCGR